MPSYSSYRMYTRRTSRPRDFQRGKVYRAERVVFRENETYTDIQELTHFVNMVTSHKAVVERYGNLHIHVDGCPANQRKGVAIRSWNIRSVVIPAWARFSSYILHEVAHHYNPIHISSHGREFCEINLFLHYVILGKKAYTTLKNSYIFHGVKFQDPKNLPEIDELSYAEAAGPTENKSVQDPKPRVERIVVTADKSTVSEWEKERREAAERLRKMMDEI